MKYQIVDASYPRNPIQHTIFSMACYWNPKVFAHVAQRHKSESVANASESFSLILQNLQGILS
jgi:hypothetical protein